MHLVPFRLGPLSSTAMQPRRQIGDKTRRDKKPRFQQHAEHASNGGSNVVVCRSHLRVADGLVTGDDATLKARQLLAQRCIIDQATALRGQQRQRAEKVLRRAFVARPKTDAVARPFVAENPAA